MVHLLCGARQYQGAAGSCVDTYGSVKFQSHRITLKSKSQRECSDLIVLFTFSTHTRICVPLRQQTTLTYSTYIQIIVQFKIRFLLLHSGTDTTYSMEIVYHYHGGDQCRDQDDVSLKFL